MPGSPRPLRILSLSCVFPTADEPQRGIFVHERLKALARVSDLRVVAPVGFIRWGAPRRWRRGVRHAARRPDQALEVVYPRWLYLPNDGWLNAVLLFAQLLPRLAWLRRKRDWDLLDAHFGHPAGIAAALLAAALHCPFIVTLRGNELDHARSRSRRRLLGWAMRRSGLVVAVSSELRDLALELGVAPRRTVVSPNGVDSSRFRLGGRRAARKKLGLEPDRPIVLSVGSLNPTKRTLDVLQAVALLLPSFPRLRLVVAGKDGTGAKTYARQVRKLAGTSPWKGKVSMLGEIGQDVLVEWLNAADVLCLASTREGCPNAVLEALACGLPVVATRVGAVPDLIPSDDYGITAPPAHPEALADALRRALGQHWNREAIAEWGRSRSWDRVAAELLPRYAEAAGEARPIDEESEWTSR